MCDRSFVATALNGTAKHHLDRRRFLKATGVVWPRCRHNVLCGCFARAVGLEGRHHRGHHQPWLVRRNTAANRGRCQPWPLYGPWGWPVDRGSCQPWPLHDRSLR